LIILIISLTLGMMGYGTTEYRLRRNTVKNNQVAPS
jgi:hypothetical protein